MFDLFDLTTLQAPLAFMRFDPMYFILVLLPSMALSGGAAWLVKSRFAKYSKVPSRNGYTGQQAAQKLLDAAGITDVRIVRVDGTLTDHYNPTNKSLALSTPVFDQTSIAAIGVATHEAGHAIQHATGYYPLKWRSLLVPATRYRIQVRNLHDDGRIDADGSRRRDRPSCIYLSAPFFTVCCCCFNW